MLPRILLLVDEYQELFEDDLASSASAQLLQLAQQGRNVGIHMLLGSQRFGVSGMLHQTAIFGNIHLRMAMKMTKADVTALIEFGSQGKRLIRGCDLPGKIVINDDSGADRANVLGKVALLPHDTVNELVAGMKDKARSLPTPLHQLTSVFDGKSPPILVNNLQLQRVLRSSRRLEPDQWEELARQPLHLHGLADENWHAGECPFAMWFGQELNMSGYGRVILRRQPLENVLVAGGPAGPRYGMLSSKLASLSCMAKSSSPPVIRIADRTPQGMPWSQSLKTTMDLVLTRAGFDTEYSETSEGLASMIAELIEVLAYRSDLDEANRMAQPPVCLILGDAERFPDLRKQPGKYAGIFVASELGSQLHRLCSEGPPLGHCCPN